MEQYRSKQLWKKYRSQVVNNVVIDKQLKTQDFDRRLRLPAIQPKKDLVFKVHRSVSPMLKTTSQPTIPSGVTQRVFVEKKVEALRKRKEAAQKRRRNQSFGC
jgi:hypothetical protein